jgi:hypothetical protein
VAAGDEYRASVKLPLNTPAARKQGADPVDELPSRNARNACGTEKLTLTTSCRVAELWVA